MENKTSPHPDRGFVMDYEPAESSGDDDSVEALSLASPSASAKRKIHSLIQEIQEIVQPVENKPMLLLDPSNDNINCLVVGQKVTLPVKQLSTWESLMGSLSIHLQMKRNIKTALPGQGYAWPELADKGRNLMIVGPPKSGKTTSYLIPLINASMEYREKQGNQAEDSDSTYNLILCPNEKSVTDVYDLTLSFIPPKKRIKVVKFSKPSDVMSSRGRKHFKEHDYDGADIVIATPMALEKALETKLIDWMGCVTLVFEEADKGLLVNLSTMKGIFKEYAQSRIQKYKANVTCYQTKKTEVNVGKAFRAMMKTVVVAEKLTDNVLTFHQEFQPNPVLIIGDYFESAIYSKIQFKTYFAEDDLAHNSNLVEAIDFTSVLLERIIVCCKNIEQAQGVEYALKGKCDGKLKIVSCNESLKITDYNRIRTSWDSSKKGSTKCIMIVTDKILLTALTHINIKNADCIIHYSIPDIKGIFSTRFNLMHSLFLKHDIYKVSVVLLRPDDALQSHELVDLHERMHIEVPPALLTLRNSSPRGLCRTFASMGVCPFAKYFCFNDHFIDKNAAKNLPSFFPSWGQIKFVVTLISSVSEYFVRLEAKRSGLNEDWIGTHPVIEDFQDQLNDLRDQSPTKEDIVIGDMFAVVYSGDVVRVRIQEKLADVKAAHYETAARKQYLVYHVDTGRKTCVEPFSLLDLPDDLKNIPDLAVKVFLTGIKPINNMISWSDDDIEFIKNLFTHNADHMTAWIYLTSGGKVWLDGVKLHFRLGNLSVPEDTTCIGINKYLIQEKRAVAAPKIPYLNVGFNSHEVQLSHILDKQKEKTQKAFLDPEPSRFEDVNLVHVKSLDELFVRHSKFQSCLDDLEKEIAKSKQTPLTKLCVGLICVQKYSDDSFNRAMIVRMRKRTVDVFYVDHGETWTVDRNTLFHLEMKLLSRLPFQAIPSKLVGYQGIVDVESVYDVTRLEDNAFKNLLCKKVSSENGISHVSLYVGVDENDEEVVYHTLGKVLFDAGMDVSRMESIEMEEEMKVKKCVKYDNDELTYTDDDEDFVHTDVHYIESEKESRDNFMNTINGRIVNHTKAIKSIFGADVKGGHVARGLGSTEQNGVNGHESDSDDDDELPSHLQRVELNEYVEGEFARKEHYDADRPKCFDPLDNEDKEAEIESDDDLDLEGRDTIGFENHIQFSN